MEIGKSVSVLIEDSIWNLKYNLSSKSINTLINPPTRRLIKKSTWNLMWDLIINPMFDSINNIHGNR